jgi:ABC-type multidrug transport system ATPase subunit
MLRYFAGFYGISGGEATRRGTELLRRVGLEGSERLRLRKFSQ